MPPRSDEEARGIGAQLSRLLTDYPLTGYGVAVCSAALAALLTNVFHSKLQSGVFPFFLAAVMVSAWCGGVGPGLLATVLSSLTANYLFLAPPYSRRLDLIDLERLSAFVSVALLIIWLNAKRMSSEAALVRSERRSRALLENISDVVTVLGRDGTIRYESPAVERVLGYEPEELVGKNAFECVHPEDAPLLIARLKDALSGQSVPAPARYRFPHKDGSWRILETVGQNFEDEKGETVRVTTSRDVTDQVAMENELRATEGLLQAFFTATPAGLAIVDESLRYARINETLARMNGLPAEAHIGRTVGEVIPDMAPILEPMLRKILETGEPELNVELSREARGRPGEKSYVAASYFPLRGAEGRVCGVGTLIVDQTARRRAAEELGASEARLRLLVEQMPAILWTTDRDFRVTSSVGAGLADIGLKANEVAGRTVDGLIGTDHPASVTIAAHRRALEGESVSYEWKWKDRVYQVSVEPFRNNEGAVAGCIGVAHDITERARAKEARVYLRQRLLNVEEEERRRIARELHDQMGGDLSALSLLLRSLEESAPPGGRAGELVRSALSLTESLDGELRYLIWELRPPALDRSPLDAALEEYLDEWARRNPHEVSFRSAGFENQSLAPVVQTTVYRIVQESLNNVRKHAGARRVDVELAFDREAGRVRVVVRDDGRGFNVREGGPERYRFGLAGMNERVGLLDGRLDINSAPGKGTAVVAEIPIPSSQQGGIMA